MIDQGCDGACRTDLNIQVSSCKSVCAAPPLPHDKLRI
jgi:hypothetical protein